MTDIPIIFSAPMVLAFLRECAAPGTGKRMTRRLALSEKLYARDARIPAGLPVRSVKDGFIVERPSAWTKVKVGDRLWVREGWKPHSIYAHQQPSKMPRAKVFYLADKKYEPSNVAGIPSIHMPRWASRLTLIVTSTKTEPLQSISEDDVLAEGVEPGMDFGERMFVNPVPGHANEQGPAAWAFGELWKYLHGPESWKANPSVVALGLRVINANIDAPEAQAA